MRTNRIIPCNKGELGKPIFKHGNEVGFFLKPYDEDAEKFFTGKVEIIDKYGTFEQNIEPSYDVMVENYNGTGQPCLVKHIRESHLYIID